MITIKQIGKILRVADTENGNAVNASSTFEVMLALQHWNHEGHGAEYCPACRTEKHQGKGITIPQAVAA